MIIYNADMMINIAIKHDTIDTAIITDDFLSSGLLLKIDLNNFDKTNQNIYQWTKFNHLMKTM